MATLIIDSSHIVPLSGKGSFEVKLEVYPESPTPGQAQHLRASVDLEVRVPARRERYRGRLIVERDDEKTLSEMEQLKEKEKARLNRVVTIQERPEDLKAILADLPHAWRVVQFLVDLTPMMGDTKMKTGQGQ
jgi:hypothetical protein